VSSVLCLSFFIQFKVFYLPLCVLHFLFSIQNIVFYLMRYIFSSIYSTVLCFLFYVLHLPLTLQYFVCFMHYIF